MVLGVPAPQAIDKLRLDSEEVVPGRRPKGLGMESCVGVEYVPFSTPLPLENKVRARRAMHSMQLQFFVRGRVPVALYVVARVVYMAAPQVFGANLKLLLKEY